jgi:hypothetical protein
MAPIVLCLKRDFTEDLSSAIEKLLPNIVLGVEIPLGS